jgi:hypothetical protein
MGNCCRRFLWHLGVGISEYFQVRASEDAVLKYHDALRFPGLAMNPRSNQTDEVGTVKAHLQSTAPYWPFKTFETLQPIRIPLAGVRPSIRGKPRLVRIEGRSTVASAGMLPLTSKHYLRVANEYPVSLQMRIAR